MYVSWHQLSFFSPLEFGYFSYSLLFLFHMQQEFFRKLMELFRVCEDLENMDGLHMIFKIVKGISQYSLLSHFVFNPFVTIFCPCHFLHPVYPLAVLLNSPQIFERIFSDELIMDIIGALECKFFFRNLFINKLYYGICILCFPPLLILFFFFLLIISLLKKGQKLILYISMEYLLSDIIRCECL